jgi:DUF1680 family protein
MAKTIAALGCMMALIFDVASAAPARVSPFALTEVRLLDGPFKHAQELDHKYLLALDPDRFLHNFRVNAGLPSNVEPYGGWEAPEWSFRGHAAGHYLTALALMYASTSDERLKQRLDYFVAELAKCQDASGKTASHFGFLATTPESMYERLENGQGGTGVLYYAMHKWMAGLLDAYELGHNAQALDVLKKLADWLEFRLDRLSDKQLQNALRIEHGGINETMANLYAITKDPNHIRIAQRLNHQAIFNPLARGEDRLDDLHGNTQVPKIIGAAREYELTGNETYRTIAEFFWNRVALHRSFIFGGNTDAEHFFAVGQESKHLTQTTGEGCNTYNMLKLTRHIFSWNPSAESMDFYERGLYNHILATQHPDTGAFIYFLALEPGWRKLYGTLDQTFWCCTGSGFENHAKYGDTIFYHDDRSLYVNLFISAELQWKEKGITVRQETRFPDEDRTSLTIHAARPLDLAIKIRYPGWSGPIRVTVNGQDQPVTAQRASYVTLERQWQEGDHIDVQLPMSLHVEPLPGDASLVALMYGPIVLAGQLGREPALEHKPTEFAGAFPVARIPETNPVVPGFVTTAADLLSHVRPMPGKPLTFRTEAIGRPNDVTLVPLYRIVTERYNVYWELYDEPGWQKFFAQAGPKEEQRKADEACVLDEVWAGWAASETNHNVKIEKSVALSRDNFLFRQAPAGGFGWTLKAAAGQPMILRIGYVGMESPVFDILVEDRKIAEERIIRTRGEKGRTTTVVKSYDVPADLSTGKDAVEIRFAGRQDTGTARVIFCELSRTRVSP